MNILKHIKITGEVFCEYAFLNFDFEFEHDMTDRISTEYLFRLPAGALVSSVKIVTDTGLIIAKATTVSHAAGILDLGVSSAQLRKLDNSTYSMNLSGISKGSCRVLITAYTELKDVSGRKRLNIPLSSDCFADLDINMHQEMKCTSPTHDITLEGKIQTRVLANRDFCLEFSEFKQKNSAIAASNMFGGQMLIRVYPHIPLIRKHKKVLFVYHPDLMGSVGRCAKEFILYAAEHFCEYSLVCAEGTLNGSDTDELIDALSKITYGGEINPDKISFDADTLSIIVSEKPVCHPRFFNVTIGDFGGENHIFARDNIQKRAAEIIHSLSVIQDISVSAGNEDTEIVSASDNSVTVYTSYKGTMPKSITIRGEEIPLTDIAVYKSFAPLELVCGKLYTEKYEKLLLTATPDEIIEIRKCLEKIGVKFSVLNSESALIAILSNSKVASVRVVMPPEIKKTYSAFDERPSMFEEVEHIDKKASAKAALDIILRSMRADGAICADGEIDNEIRKKQTLLSLLALIYAGFENSAYIKYAQDFIKNYSFSEITFTKDSMAAKKFLDKFFEGKSVPARSFVPDLITSINIIRLFW